MADGHVKMEATHLQNGDTQTLDTYLKKTWNQDELESRLRRAVASVSLAGKGKSAKHYYGMRLECRNVVVDPNKRKIATDDAGNIEVTKTGWNVRESADSDWIWIDTYTAACQAVAMGLLESLGEGPWPVYIPIVFGWQLTKQSKSVDDYKDIVMLA